MALGMTQVGRVMVRDALRTKADTALVNEPLCKVLVHNIRVLIKSMYELGIEADFRPQTA
jgi:hypothetical protein